MAVTIGSVTEGNANAEEIKNNLPDSELYEKNKKYLQGSLVKFNDKIYLAKRNVPSDVDLDNPYYWEIFMDAADSKRVDELFEKTGNLDELETESKDNLVNAINEAVLYTAQSLTEEQQAQARANIGVGTPYTLPQATANTLGGVKADSTEAADTQPVRIGTDGKLYTAPGVTDISTKMDANNPVGTGSFSMNRKAGTVIGINSHTEGNQTTASRNCSHAEGINTTASGNISHAEGNQTTASGHSSHAEGNSTKATKECSHAEGYQTTAGGSYSHAEGFYTKTSADCSHAEGTSTEASGNSSHAEGYHTIANGTNSHVQGKCNIADTSNKYADIIGNGTSDTARSNAATVDWSGNAWFAGDVYTGSTSGTNKDEGSKKLATEEYVNSSIAAGGTDISLGLTSASVGQIIKVKAVDESGKPTAWEAADMSEGVALDTTLTQSGQAADAKAVGDALAEKADIPDIPAALPNPNSLTFTGAVNATYDGSTAVSVEIPSGGSGGTDISLGLTSASVGQTIKVKAVDESGKPTEWEAADMPSGGGWRKIAGSEFDGSETIELVVTTDENGETFSLKKMLLILHTPNATNNTLLVRLYNAGAETGDIVFFSSAFPAVKKAPVVSYVDFTTPFPTGWAAQTSGYFNQNALGFLGGSRDPRVESSAIAKIEIRNATGGYSYLGANCFYEIWGVDA